MCRAEYDNIVARVPPPWVSVAAVAADDSASAMCRHCRRSRAPMRTRKNDVLSVNNVMTHRRSRRGDSTGLLSAPFIHSRIVCHSAITTSARRSSRTFVRRRLQQQQYSSVALAFLPHRVITKLPFCCCCQIFLPYFCAFVCVL